MCGAAVLVVGMVITAVAGALSAYGQYQQGKYQAKVAKRNAQLAEYDAEKVKDQGRAQEARHRILVAQEIGRQRYKHAKQNVVLGGPEGLDLSADLAMADAQHSGEWEALAIRWQNSELAKRYKLQAADYLSQSKLYNRAAGFNLATGLLQTTGSVLSMASGFGGSTPSTPMNTGLGEGSSNARAIYTRAFGQLG